MLLSIGSEQGSAGVLVVQQLTDRRALTRTPFAVNAPDFSLTATKRNLDWFRREHVQAMDNRLTAASRQAVSLAEAAARTDGQPFSSGYLLLGLTGDNDSLTLAQTLLAELNVTFVDVHEILRQQHQQPGATPGQRTAELDRVLRDADISAQQLQSMYVGSEHLLLACAAASDSEAAAILQTLGIAPVTVTEHVMERIAKPSRFRLRSAPAVPGPNLPQQAAPSSERDAIATEPEAAVAPDTSGAPTGTDSIGPALEDIAASLRVMSGRAAAPAPLHEVPPAQAS